jgi:deoxycytidylate deaminase
MNRPHDIAIQVALDAAAESPCAKSRRGVAAFVEDADRDWYDGRRIVAVGHNGPPAPFMCDGTSACRADCGRRCVHAEMRALRQVVQWPMPERVRLVHVKIDGRGELVAGPGPSCWQCSREVLDVGIAGVWLYELDARGPTTSAHVEGLIHGTGWRFYSALDFHRATLEACEIGGPR